MRLRRRERVIAVAHEHEGSALFLGALLQPAERALCGARVLYQPAFQPSARIEGEIVQRIAGADERLYDRPFRVVYKAYNVGHVQTGRGAHLHARRYAFQHRAFGGADERPSVLIRVRFQIGQAHEAVTVAVRQASAYERHALVRHKPRFGVFFRSRGDAGQACVRSGQKSLRTYKVEGARSIPDETRKFFPIRRRRRVLIACDHRPTRQIGSAGRQQKSAARKYAHNSLRPRFFLGLPPPLALSPYTCSITSVSITAS